MGCYTTSYAPSYVAPVFESNPSLSPPELCIANTRRVVTPLPPAANVLKVQLGWGVDADSGAMTVLHFTYTGGPPSSTNCATMAAAISADQATRFAPLLSIDSYVRECTVRDLASDTGGEGTAGDLADGTRTGGQLAPATSIVVSKHIGRHYRGGHPRSYLPLGTSSDVGDGGRWNAPFPADVKTAYDSFITDVLSDGAGCVITGEVNLSYFSGGARRVTPQRDVIVSTTVSDMFGSQRRRNRKQ